MKRIWLRLSALAILLVSISACTGDVINAVFEDALSPEAYKHYNDVLRTRSTRIQALLGHCTGAPASEAAAASAAIASATAGLDDSWDSNLGSNPTQAEADQHWRPVLDAQLRAYNAAVACGLASPQAVDPGGWSATWWDISSEE